MRRENERKEKDRIKRKKFGKTIACRPKKEEGKEKN